MSTANINPASAGDILIVDDTQSDLKLLTDILRKTGYTVRPASDGELALRTVQARLPELILLDIQMPGLDGYEVCRRLKDSEDTRDIPVIFISVKTSPIDKVKAFGLGGVDYITKPFEPEEVLARVATHLALWKAQKEIEEKNLQLQQEITERVWTEEALRRSEAKYRRLVEQVPAIIYMAALDEASTILYVSPQIEAVLGYTQAEYSADPDLWRKRLHPEDRDRVIEEVQRSHVAGEPFCSEYRMLTHDGREVWLRDEAVVVWDDTGQPLFLQGIMRDVTERKRAEKEIRHLNAVLRAIRNVNQLIVTEKNQDRLVQGVCDRIIESRGYFNAWIVMFDESGRVITTAEAGLGKDFLPLAERLKRGDLTDCVQRSLTQSEPVVIEEPVSACPDCPLSNMYGERGALTVQLRYLEKAYGVLCASIPRKFTLDDEERSLFKELGDDIAFAMHNIGLERERELAEEERKKLEAQFRQAQKMEAIGVLAGGVAHDFNNLLTAILGNTQLALMKVIKDESLREGIQEIEKAGLRAASLTRQLLAFSRKQIIKPKILDVNEVINETEKMLKRMVGEDIEFLLVLEPELRKVYTDPGQIDQVVMNLVINARDAMPRGGRLTIETANVELDETYFQSRDTESKPGPYVMLAVTDNGTGIDKETLSRIFDPFFTTKEVGSGTGLSLSTVYGIVKQNKGYVWVYSEPGKGTTFKIYFPRVAKDVVIVGKEQEEFAGGISGSETVLIVEDDDALRNITKKILQKYGYNILEAENGEKALNIGETHEGSIHLLLTDVVMPVMSGSELSEKLQSIRPETRVIYMSGYTDNAIVRHGILKQEINFIEKPFSPESLGKKVRQVLDGGN